MILWHLITGPALTSYQAGILAAALIEPLLWCLWRACILAPAVARAIFPRTKSTRKETAYEAPARVSGPGRVNRPVDRLQRPDSDMFTVHTAGNLRNPAITPGAGLTSRPTNEAGMSERQNVIVISSATPEQIRRAALRINNKKYPRHAEALARVEAQLKELRRAA